MEARFRARETGRSEAVSAALGEGDMRVRGEIVFPNNIKQLRLRKQLTQAQLGRLMDPPIAESTISKMESGERRLTNLQLANLAALFGCRPEAIPVVAARDPAPGVRQWQDAQEAAVRHSIDSGAAAIGYVLAQLRKKSGRTMQQVAQAIGMTLSVYHRVEMASRLVSAKEIEALAKLYGITAARLVGMFERRTHDNRIRLEQGVQPEELLPRTPRSLLKHDARWGRLGALERHAMQRNIRYVHRPDRETALPLYGTLRVDDDGGRRFVIDRADTVDRIAISELLAPEAQSFLVRNFSQRLGLLLKPGAIAYVDPQAPVAIGDLVFLVRRDGTAEAAAVVDDGLGPLKLRMHNPEGQIPLDDQQIAAVLRICAVILS
jgi:transcriptional regulator with XRE-family HTH domain